MKRPNNITLELKNVSVMLSEYIKVLEAENLKLHKDYAKLSVHNVSLQNEIVAIKKAKPQVKVVIQKYAEIK